MRSIVFEDNRNSRRYWIYTLIITTYCMNKRGFHCAHLRAVFSLILSFPYLHSSLFFSSMLFRFLAHFFFLFSLYPCRSRTRYLSHTSRLLVSLLHHYTTRINWELPLESARLFYLTRYFQKIYITIYLFISLKHVSRRTKTCVGSLVSFVCSS